ncbi:MAG: energy transducer TonB [Burkholderiaceae bacterium]|jgi:protein TonB|nr:energy transducer TonB [Gammaproteobacteria bacterium]MBK9468703.1 energy transducer TonB [Gammaproteobacteria bacterium]MBP7660171.1 energy transducer TonB [Burkholderiaceae bacterium]
MAVLAIRSTRKTRCDWLRITGFSGTLGMHVLALVLLAIPMALPDRQPAQPDTPVTWIEAAAEPIVFEVPDPPVPMRPSPVRVPRSVPTPVHDAPSTSTAAEPVTPVLAGSDAPAVEPVADAPPAGESSALEYESIVRPNYPRLAIRNREEGTVLVRVTVGRDGLPIHSEVARSSGSRYLDKEALEVVLRWRFRPVRRDGVGVQASGLVPIDFKLDRR